MQLCIICAETLDLCLHGPDFTHVRSPCNATKDAVVPVGCTRSVSPPPGQRQRDLNGTETLEAYVEFMKGLFAVLPDGNPEVRRSQSTRHATTWRRSASSMEHTPARAARYRLPEGARTLNTARRRRPVLHQAGRDDRRAHLLRIVTVGAVKGAAPTVVIVSRRMRRHSSIARLVHSGRNRLNR